MQILLETDFNTEFTDLNLFIDKCIDPKGSVSSSNEEEEEGCTFLSSAALFHYRQQSMNYTEPVSTSIIEVKTNKVCWWK